MKFLLCFLMIILSFSNDIVAQHHSDIPFLQRNSIRWAGFLSDTVRFSSPNLSLQIRVAVQQNRLKVFSPALDSPSYYMTRQEIDDSFEPLIDPIFDSSGNPVFIPERKKKDPLFDSSYYAPYNNDLVYASQFMYIENGLPKSHVLFVSPMARIETDQGFFIGSAMALNAYFNNEELSENLLKEPAIKLGSTKKTLTDSSFTDDSRIKQWYDETPIKLIWPSLGTANVDIYRTDIMKKIGVSDLTEKLLYLETNPDTVRITKFANGVVDTPSIYYKNLYEGDIRQTDILQDWYFIPSRQIVYNIITGLVLYASKRSSDYNDKCILPVLKIVYK